MKVTFLGHQSWLVESSDFRLLLDPILTPHFRNSEHSRAWLYPPRRIDLTRLGSIGAVYFTHEHEDHFHIESIHALPRAVPIYLSGNMSAAAERILSEMGFSSIHRLFAADRVALGRELEMTVFAPPAALAERWVLQPFIKGNGYADSFFNAVDCEVSHDFLRRLQTEKVRQIGLVCTANNKQTPRTTGNPNAYRSTAPTTGAIFEPAMVLTSHLGVSNLPPMRCLAIVGGGFIEETAPFGTFLCPSQRRLAEVLQEYSHGSVRIVGPEPGDWLDLQRHPLTVEQRTPDSCVVDSVAGQAALERAESLARTYEPGSDFQPVTGRRTLDEAQRERLQSAAQDLSKLLAAHPMHAEMMQQAHHTADSGRTLPYGEGRLLLILRQETGPLALEYRPARRAFERTERLPGDAVMALYPFGFECWASDFLALLEGELSVYELIKFAHRAWEPGRAYLGRFNFAGTLEDLFAPEVAMETTYALYRRAYERARSSLSQQPM